jgi:phage shock protein A
MTWNDNVYEALDRANRRAEKAEAERDGYKEDAREFDRQADAFYERIGELRQVLNTIAYNHDIDPRAEARHALEDKP